VRGASSVHAAYLPFAWSVVMLQSTIRPEPGQRVSIPRRRLAQLLQCHLDRLDAVAVPERPLTSVPADDDEDVPVAVVVDERPLAARAEEDDTDHVFVSARFLQQRLKHALLRT
jgi:hypothetical protein